MLLAWWDWSYTVKCNNSFEKDLFCKCKKFSSIEIVSKWIYQNQTVRTLFFCCNHRISCWQSLASSVEAQEVLSLAVYGVWGVCVPQAFLGDPIPRFPWILRHKIEHSHLFLPLLFFRADLGAQPNFPSCVQSWSEYQQRKRISN